MIPAQVQKWVARIERRIEKLLEKGDVENLVESTEMVSIDRHGQNGQSQKKNMSLEGMFG